MSDDAESRTEAARVVGRPFQKGQSGNPGGRQPKTDDERAGETYLRERTLAAAQVLVELQGEGHEPKIRLGAVTSHLKITLGVLERKAGPNGEELPNPFKEMSEADLAAFALWRLSLLK